MEKIRLGARSLKEWKNARVPVTCRHNEQRELVGHLDAGVVKHDVFRTTRFSSRIHHAPIPHDGSLETRLSDLLLVHNSLYLLLGEPGEPGERVLRSGDFRINRLNCIIFANSLPTTATICRKSNFLTRDST